MREWLIDGAVSSQSLCPLDALTLCGIIPVFVTRLYAGGMVDADSLLHMKCKFAT
jgi:hypothetical protein